MHEVGKAYFSSEVLKDSSTVHGCCGSYTTVAGCAGLQVPVDTTHWELAERETWQWFHFNQRSRPSWQNYSSTKTKTAELKKREMWSLKVFTCSPALWERDTAFALALPLSFPALPPACVRWNQDIFNRKQRAWQEGEAWCQNQWGYSVLKVNIWP